MADPGEPTVAEFKSVIKRTLQECGALDRARGLIRAELYKAIRDETLTSPPHLSNENLMINELIREYLDFNGYRDTMSVMLPETGQPVVPAFSRSFLARRLHLPETPETRRVPLLYVMLELALEAAVPGLEESEGDSGSVEDSAPTLREAMNRARARAHALTSGEPRQPSGRDKG